MSRARPEAIAVLDVGKTNCKLLAIDPGGRILFSRAAPNEVRPPPPYLHVDVDHLWRWLMAALADLGERFALLAIVPTTHGSSAALVGEDGLVLPVMDYEAEPPPEVVRAYAEVAPWFEECCCPVNPAGLTLGRQLLWQSRAWPEAFARARWILPYPQYWAWRLSGVAAAEVTSLGAQTQLWNPRTGACSGLAIREGWAARLPPLRPAWSVLGPISAGIAAATGLPAGTPVLCGIHDSNANYARYLAGGLRGFTLISTGTWLITFSPALPLDALDPLRDTVANIDLDGRPVASARFMGGREYALIAGEDGLRARPEAADVAALIAAGTLALPSFTDSGGPFPGSGGKGRIVGPAPATPRRRAALACLYVALMAAVDLDLLRARPPLVIDGPLASNRLLCSLLAALREGQELRVSREPEGTAIGAALLWRRARGKGGVALDLEPVAPLAVEGLEAYAERWRTAASAARPG